MIHQNDTYISQKVTGHETDTKISTKTKNNNKTKNKIS